MKQKFKILFVLLLILEHAKAQDITSINARIFKIINYKECLILKSVNADNGDTINIISNKRKIDKIILYKKMKIGNSYTFLITKMGNSQAALDDNFSIRTGDKIIWKPKDGYKNIPVIAQNANGMYIKK